MADLGRKAEAPRGSFLIPGVGILSMCLGEPAIDEDTWSALMSKSGPGLSTDNVHP